LAGVAVAATGLASCISDRPDPSGPTPGTGDPVRIVDFAYAPPEITVRVGQALTWINEDPVPHTVTADDRSFDSSTFGEGETYRLRTTLVGTFPYFCELHPFMRGTLDVVD
jgi:plastocyanin